MDIKSKLRKILKILLSLLVLIILVLGLITLIINVYMINMAKKYILDNEEASSYSFDCITVLGASVKANGTPSTMLKDRLDQALILYFDGVSSKILMSGDHAYDDYDEVNTMKNYAINKSVPSSDIFMDHAGLNTYDSMYRLKNIYEVNKTIIVTQDYHLYRAIYIARKLGLDAYGVASDPQEYSGQLYRDMREVLARVKDYFLTIFKPKSTYTGSTIPVIGDGNATNDR